MAEADPGTNAALVAAIGACLTRHGRPTSQATLAAALGPSREEEAVLRGLGQLGIAAAWLEPDALTEDILPAIALREDGTAGIVIGLSEGWPVLAGDADAGGAAVAPEEIGRCLAFGTATMTDNRATDLVEEARGDWFWPVLWNHRRFYFEAAAHSAVINLLSLAGIIFTMTVYDRILPNQAFVTLWSLLAGVVLAMIFEFVSRTVRGHALDAAGQKIDLILGDTVFSRVLATRLEHRARSSGAFANILKEFEAVRGFVTSATLVAVADLPFALLYLAVCALIGGKLVFVPLVAFVLVAGLSLAIQAPMSRLANENLREAAVRHGTVIESLEGLETLKALRA